MALEAVVFPQDPFGCTMKELCNLGGGIWGFDFGEVGGGDFEEWDVNAASPETREGKVVVAAGRRKRRRRTQRCKNEEEVENQRITHIAIERNRRKQMNEYLAMLRSLMPPSYVQRGDQASIVGGAINFLKELEQFLHSLEAKKKQRTEQTVGRSSSSFTDFFNSPQYSSCPLHNSNTTAIADIEVSMAECHANLKVLSRRRPKQILKMVVELQNLRLTTLHLNVTTADSMALYSFSLKVEEDSQFTSVDDIADAVYRMVGRIQEEAGVE